MNFWTAFAAYLVACALVYMGLTVNGKSTDADHGAHDHGHGGHKGHH